MPVKASNNCTEIKDYQDVGKSLEFMDYKWENKEYKIALVNESFQHSLRAAYYSAVSFMDNEFGKIIQGLYEYDLWDNTIITITGDHGWHLGEQGCFSKFTNFEVGVRVPLSIRIPGMNKGKYSDILVEQLDLFPTIIDASGVGYINGSYIERQLEGKSLFAIIKDPNIWQDYYAYSQYPRGKGENNPDDTNFTVMGISMRTSQWRYTEWLGWDIGSNISKPYVISLIVTLH